MKKILIAITCCVYSFIVWGQQTKKITVEIKNKWSYEQTDAPVAIDIQQLNLGFEVKSAVVTIGHTELTSQLDDLNNDRRADELAFVVDLGPQEAKQVEVTLSSEPGERKYEPRVYAEMLISDKKGKHVPIKALTIPGTSNTYNQLHHHGPAFESELVAYRLYFDQKQTVDPYGKFNKGFEIEESQFYPTDEQLARGFGDDVLRVSGSAGVGAFKGWNGKKAVHIEPVATRTQRILAYGPVRTIVEAENNDWEYKGKKLNMINRYTLYAGHRDVIAETFFEEANEELFSTGVQDVKGSVSYSDHQGLIACWGTDWPVNDTVKYAKETVGLAVCIPSKYVVEEAKDNANYLYTISPKGGQYIRYYLMFTSKKETFGYPTAAAWFERTKAWKKELENPVTISIKQ